VRNIAGDKKEFDGLTKTGIATLGEHFWHMRARPENHIIKVIWAHRLYQSQTMSLIDKVNNKNS